MEPISRVSVVSTGGVQIRPQHMESTGSPLLWWLLTSRRWTAPLPIYVYVIEHEQGLVLFDNGLRESSRAVQELAGRHLDLLVMPAYDPQAAARLTRAPDARART